MKTPERGTRGTISIHFVREAVRDLPARGLDVPALLQQSGIPPAFLAEPLARVSPQQFGTLWQAIARKLDDEFFGLDRHPMREGSYNLMCHAALGSADLRQALRRVLRFFKLVLDDVEGHVEVEGKLAWIRLEGREPPRLFAHATFLIMVFGLACWLTGRRIPLQAAHFRSPLPADDGEREGERVAAEYRVLFCEQLAFGAPDTRVALPASALALPVVQNTRTVGAFLQTVPASFLVKYRNPKSVASQVRRRLRALPPPAWPDLRQLCNELHLAEATLRRRLQDEGHTYQSLKDELRRDRAIEALQRGRLAIPDIAAELGYSEPSAFYRAFRKWTGALPSEYRASQQGDGLPPAG